MLLRFGWAIEVLQRDKLAIRILVGPVGAIGRLETGVMPAYAFKAGTVPALGSE